MAATPATAPKPVEAPTSTPEKAHAVPASGPTPADPRSKLAPLQARSLGVEFDTEGACKGMKPEVREDLSRTIKAYCPEPVTGTIRDAHGAFRPYSIKAREVVELPKWFAIQHPKHFIIKE